MRHELCAVGHVLRVRAQVCVFVCARARVRACVRVRARVSVHARVRVWGHMHGHTSVIRAYD